MKSPIEQAKNQLLWTVEDLKLFAEDDKRYEIIQGELFVTRAPHWQHQTIADNICYELKLWSRKTGLGKPVTACGIIFSETDSVIPDVAWVKSERLESILDNAGHLTAAPDLVVEVLSPGKEQEKRDRQLKLKLYSIHGVLEYWVVDRDRLVIEIYRRENAVLKLAATLYPQDNLTSDLLPGFSCSVAAIFEL